ncbi:MAG TPA: hypothetical protein VJN95_13180 [Gemmatimonadales bacterium]|nr:hypothetical protein [Gemmatimonadales bacterium]
MRRPIVIAVIALASCRPAGRAAAPADSTRFAAMQERGRMVMGVDQYTSQHVFEDLPDGGRIVLDRPDTADAAGIATIREHMRTIAAAFARGDFALPGQVHDQAVPGTDVMSARHGLIRYQAADRPRGGEVRITTTDSLALDAVHRFLAFQRSDHRAAGHEHVM